MASPVRSWSTTAAPGWAATLGVLEAGGRLARAQSALFAPLRVRSFRWAWSGRVVSLCGDNFQVVTLAVVAVALTERAAGLGALLAVQAVPRALLMRAGGLAADRFRPQAVIVAASLAQGLLTAALAALALQGTLAVWHLVVYAAATGVAAAFSLPAAMAVVPEVLPPELVPRGNALWSLAFNLARFVAPPLAGVVVALGGAGAAFAANAASFVTAAGVFAGVRTTPRPPAPRRAALHELIEGVRAARHDRVVWISIVSAPVYTLGSTGATLVALPALAALELGAGETGVGLLFGALGAGAVLGAFATGAVEALPRQGVVGGGLCVAVGVSLALAGAAPSLWLAAPAVALAGAFQAAVVVFFTLVQTRAPAAARGRVLALYSLGIFGPTPVSFALAGFGADALGPRLVLALGGALVALCGAIALSAKTLRDLE